MKRISSYFIIIMLFFVQEMNGQSPSSTAQADLEKLYSRLVSNYNDSARLIINDSIKHIIDSYVESDTLFYHKFNNIRYLGQVTSPDSVLKIISWNLVLLNLPGRYYCYIIRRNQYGFSNTICRLTSEYRDARINTDTVYTEDKWYGALYYDIRPHFFNNDSCWILLGIDYGNPLITRKIIDVVRLDESGKAIFGMKWFTSSEKVKFRDVFEYASTATMSLRFSPDGSIVFDHLVPFSPELADDRQYYGPHYSTDAYLPENGMWRLRMNVDARNKE